MSPNLFPSLLEVLVMFAITFGAMNKLPKSLYFLPSGEERAGFIGQLLRCSYCVGFHAGWLTWLFVAAMKSPELWISMLPSAPLYALSGAAGSYLLDVLSAAAERHGR
jgi:hypothetical protein